MHPYGHPEAPGVWGDSGEEVGQHAMLGSATHADAQGGAWLRNALDNTEQELDSMQTKASKFAGA